MIRKVMTENGMVKGLPAADPRITAFKGVPFAAPPVGANRWRAPQKCENWEGIRNAYEFGPISMQDQPAVGTDIYCREWHVDPDIPMNEDCLYLNIWTSAKTGDEKMPVLVWFFGGAFTWGYTAEMEFDGERLAKRGIVVVSVAYRTGVFGFLSHPELTRSQPEDPANFGLLDQQAGLMWVVRNIAAFGGDPDNISIAGQSAGGGSVLHQLTHEANYPYIKSAAVFSGMIYSPDLEDDVLTPKTIDHTEKIGEEFFKYAGYGSLEEARRADAVSLRDVYSEFMRIRKPNMMVPCIDGKFATGNPYMKLFNGDWAKVPLLAGNTADEFRELAPDADYCIIEPAIKSVMAKNNADGNMDRMYYYRFNADIPGWDDPKTFHSVDLWFFFESLAKCWRPFKGHHYDLSRQMCNYWAEFIKKGDPNGKDADGSDMPKWEPYGSSHTGMEFKPEGPTVSGDSADVIDAVRDFTEYCSK